LSSRAVTADLTAFEFEELAAPDQASKSKLESILARAEEIFASAKSFITDTASTNSAEAQNRIRTTLQREIAAETEKLG